jgi:hypothetical protein
MIHVNSVTAALHGLLTADPVLVASGFTVEEGEAFNHDLNLTPWVGIYHGTLGIDPRTLGGAQPWEGQLELAIYVQEASMRSGQEATRRLSQAQAAVLGALNADRTLGGAVLMLTGMDVMPYQRDLAEDTWLFTNEIALKATVRG